MAVSIDNYLRSLSYDRYYLKNDSSETDKISRSLDALIKNLNTDMGVLIRGKIIFGSYDRDTILPRKIDTKSDVDLMVIFNHTEHERTPETYRTWLKLFADKYYKDKYGSEVIKSFPTVTIRLSNIHYDLVPAKQENNLYFGSTLYIPDSGNSWRTTNPKDVKDKLTEANTKYNSIVKPIIRILKAWNASNSYPFESYELEKTITQMNFFNDNIQTGFFYAANQLSSNWGDPQTKSDKISSLKYNIQKAKECLELNDSEKAKQWLSRILP
jgi:hypothetical protein